MALELWGGGSFFMGKTDLQISEKGRSDFSEEKFDAHFTPLLSFGIDLFPTKKLSIGIGFTYSERVFGKSDFTTSRNLRHPGLNRNVIVVYTAEKGYTQKAIQLPITFTYYFSPSEQHFTPFVRAGGFITHAPKVEGGFLFEKWEILDMEGTDIQPNWPEVIGPKLESETRNGGFFGGLGLRMKLHPRLFANIYAQYAWEENVYTFTPYKFTTQRFELGATLCFRFLGETY